MHEIGDLISLLLTGLFKLEPVMKHPLIDVQVADLIISH